MIRSSNMHQMNSPSSSFADKSHPPMELTEEHRKQFAAMWDNVPSENVVHLSQEEYDAFVSKLNNPPVPNEALKKAFADDRTAKGMQQLWQHSENYLQQLRQEIHKKMGVPENLAVDDLPPNV